MARFFSRGLAIFLFLHSGFAQVFGFWAPMRPALAAQNGPDQQTALFYQWYIPTARHATSLCRGGAGGGVLDDPALPRFVSATLLMRLQAERQGGCLDYQAALDSYFLHTSRAGAVGALPADIRTVVQTATRSLVRAQVADVLLCVRLRHEREGWRIIGVELPGSLSAQSGCME